jgi:hypothetical protein
MTADVFRAIFNELDFKFTQQFKDLYSNAKERRIVKKAVRAMSAQNIAPKWELLVEHYLVDKVSLADERKIAELQDYFAVEMERALDKSSLSNSYT